MYPNAKFLLSHFPQMRANISRLPTGSPSPQNPHKKSILLTLTLILVTLIFLHYMHDDLSFLLSSQEIDVKISPPLHHKKSPVNPNDRSISMRLRNTCNIFSGKWVPFPKGPYYTNESGCVIEDKQNCMKFGRPDTEFMKWRWRPDDCELPLFDPTQFLEMVRGKSMAFVGDSLARNQVQSLGCLLSRIARPVDKSYEKYPRSKIWVYPDHNFTLSLLMTTHLVKSKGVNDLSGNPVEIHLDKVDEAWSTQVQNFDYVIISGGYWYSRPVMYYENNTMVGCSMCGKDNITDLTRYYGFRKAYRATFGTLLDRNFKGTVILRTMTPLHFEVEEAEGRGNCVRTMPYKKDELRLDWETWMYYMIQVEEFFKAKTEGKKRVMEFKLLDITEAMRPRPDGHPNHYGQQPEERFMLYADCLHWCLPGPIDLWNELLLQVMKTEDYSDM